MTGMKPMTGGIEHLIAGALLTVAKQLRAAGASPTHCLQLAAVAMIGAALGRKPLHELGIPEGTVRRWWREVEAAAGSMDEVNIEGATQVINAMLESMGLPLRVVDPDA